MPIYEYKCTDGHTFEVIQSMSDDPVAECEVCGKPVERVFHPVAVHFKGSGFYTTDYARQGAKAASGDGGEKKDSESKGSEAKSDTTSSTSTEKASKSTSSSD